MEEEEALALNESRLVHVHRRIIRLTLQFNTPNIIPYDKFLFDSEPLTTVIHPRIHQ